MKRRPETLVGQLNREEPAEQQGSGYTPLQKYGLLAGFILGILFVTYSLLGFFFVPWVIKREVTGRLNESPALTGEIGSVRFNPYTWSGVFQELEIKDERERPALRFERLSINFQAATFFREGIVLKEVLASRPEVNLIRGEDGSLNIFSLFQDGEKRPDEAASGNATARFQLTISNARISEGTVRIRDERPDAPFETMIRPIDISLKHFSTGALESDSVFSLQAEGETGFLFETEGEFRMDPFYFNGAIKIADLGLHHYHPYFQPFFNFEIVEGLASADFMVTLDGSGKAFAFQLQDGGVSISEASLKPRNKSDPFMELKRIELGGLNLDSVRRFMGVRQVRLEDGEAIVIRDAENNLNVTDYFQFQMEMPIQEDRAPWEYEIGGMELIDFNFLIEDRALPESASYEVIVQHLNLGEIGSAGSRVTPLDAALGIGERGQVELSGIFEPFPTVLQMSVSGKDLPLEMLNPYLSPIFSAEIQSGNGFFDGGFSLDQSGGEKSEMRISGKGNLEDFRLSNVSTSDSAMEIASLSMDGLEMEVLPRAVKIERIALEGVSGNLIRTEEGIWSLPFQIQDGDLPVDSEGAKEESGGASPFQVSIGKVWMNGAELNLLDRSLETPFEASVTGVKGELTQFSTAPGSRAQLNFEGSIDGRGSWTLEGDGNFRDMEEGFDLVFQLDPLGVGFLSPYSATYMGRRLDRGNMEMDLSYQVAGYELTGENRIEFNQLTLGEKVESEDQVINVPLDFAIATLQDRQGILRMNVGVSGRLDDPSFNVSGIVMRVILNSLGRAATSPFSILAGLVSSDKELSHVTFQPGSSEISEEARLSLKQLTDALEQRPRLGLELYATYDPEEDRKQMKRNRMEALLSEIQSSHPEAPREDYKRDETAYQQLLDLALSEGDAVSTGVRAERSPMELAGEVYTEDGEASVEEEVEFELEVARVERAPGFWERLFGVNQAEGVTEQESAQITEPVPSGPIPVESEDEIDLNEVPLKFPEELPPVEELEAQLLDRITIEESQFAELARRREEVVFDYLREEGIEESRLGVLDSNREEISNDSPRVHFHLTDNK